MKRASVAAAVVAGAMSWVSPAAVAQGKVDIGKREFQANCAVCHGAQGKGDGPYAGMGTQRVPDLTVLAKANGGVFPLARVYEVIEGERDIKAHGTRDMPIWGQEYKKKAAEYYMDAPYDPEAYVRARILALSEYIYRLQQK